MAQDFRKGLTNSKIIENESLVDGYEGSAHRVPKSKAPLLTSSPAKTTEIITQFLKSKNDIDEVTPEVGTIKKVLQPSQIKASI